MIAFGVNSLEPLQAASWPQFKGPHSSAVAPGTKSLPDAIGPGTNEVWSIELLSGVSSPVVLNDQIFLTGVRDGNTLVTFSLSVTDGALQWEDEAPINRLEKTDKRPKGRLATSTCATDGKHLVSFFGSSGLLCFSLDGKRLWHRSIGPFDNTRGAVSSPFILEDRVILLQDHNQNSFIAAYSVETGEVIWKSDRRVFNRSHCSPMFWENSEGRFVVAVSSGVVTGYDFETGKTAWFARGTSSVVNITPVADDADTLYVTSANPGPQRGGQLTFEALLKKTDKDGDGEIARSECEPGFVREVFGKFDGNGDSHLDKAEYEGIQSYFRTCRNGMFALRAGGDSLDRTESNIQWHVKKGLPRTACPIYHEGVLFMLSDGGIFHTIDPKDGSTIKMSRVPGRGKSFGSPALGDGKVYAITDRGECVVVSAEADWKLLSSSEFEEPVYPSPAIADGRIYVRTESKLYCFGVE